MRLLLPLARRHGLQTVWITCNPDNWASRRTCELAGAELRAQGVGRGEEGMAAMQRGQDGGAVDAGFGDLAASDQRGQRGRPVHAHGFGDEVVEGGLGDGPVVLQQPQQCRRGRAGGVAGKGVSVLVDDDRGVVDRVEVCVEFGAVADVAGQADGVGDDAVQGMGGHGVQYRMAGAGWPGSGSENR